VRQINAQLVMLCICENAVWVVISYTNFSSRDSVRLL